MRTADENSLERFVQAQERVYDEALAELRAGDKQSHWVWFVLPQLRGLGHSPMARFYGLADAAEAEAYAAHPVLGPRLVECVHALVAHKERTAAQMLGKVDAMKLRSCLTLFACTASQQPIFAQALDQLFAGERDEVTLRRLAAGRR